MTRHRNTAGQTPRILLVLTSGLLLHPAMTLTTALAGPGASVLVPLGAAGGLWVWALRIIWRGVAGGGPHPSRSSSPPAQRGAVPRSSPSVPRAPGPRSGRTVRPRLVSEPRRTRPAGSSRNRARAHGYPARSSAGRALRAPQALSGARAHRPPRLVYEDSRR
ncbi:hypothetical protein GCM10027294_48620 [Marinactinospora endophytica]